MRSNKDRTQQRILTSQCRYLRLKSSRMGLTHSYSKDNQNHEKSKNYEQWRNHLKGLKIRTERVSVNLVTKRLLTIAKRNFNCEKWHNSNGLNLNKIKMSFLVALAMFQMFNRQMWLLTTITDSSDTEHLQPHQYSVGK